jgi:hypothetical protein
MSDKPDAPKTTREWIGFEFGVLAGLLAVTILGAGFVTSDFRAAGMAALASGCGWMLREASRG